MRRVFGSLLALPLCLAPHAVHAAAPTASLEDLTRQVRTLHGRLRADDTDAVDQLRQVAITRYRRLAAVIADRPDLVLRHAFSAAERSALPPAVRPYIEQEHQADGELLVAHEDGPTESRYRYSLKGPTPLALYFAADPPPLETGDRISVTGVRVDNALALGSDTTQVTVQAAATSPTADVLATLVILVNFQDRPTDALVTPTQASAVMFGASASVSSFYNEASYQRTSLAGDVMGPYTIAVNSTGCDPTTIAAAAQQAATAHGATVTNYARLVYAFPTNACPWLGRGNMGGFPGETWLNGYFTPGLIAHEMGHNFGLYHSHAWDCGASPIGSGCSAIEYGDTLDSMGETMVTASPKHFNAVQKERIGWLNTAGAPPITTVQASGVYTIDPYEPVGVNPKALKVRTPSGDWYYVEYRQPIGFDSVTVASNANVRSGVVVHLWTLQHPDKIYLLDMTSTESWLDPALGVNQTFTDSAAGISITPLWADGTTAGVNVSVGGGAVGCVRANPTVSASPAQQQSPAGGTLTYTLSIRNNDSGCAASNFAPSAVVSTGWVASFASSSLGVAAGATVSTTVQVTSPAGAAAGSFTIGLSAANMSASSYASSTSAVYAVTSAGTSFADAFDRADAPTLGSAWQPIAGVLSIQSGEARNPAVKAMSMARVVTVAGADQTVSARFASLGNAGYPRFGVILRFQDASNYYACYRRVGSSSVRIVKVTGGTERLLKSVTVPNPATGQFFAVGCQAQGKTLTLTLDGVVKITVSDATFTSGGVGLLMGYAGGQGAGLSHRADDFSAIVR